jgi:hypothetical protein
MNCCYCFEGGAEEAAALHQLPQAAGRPGRVRQVGVNKGLRVRRQWEGLWQPRLAFACSHPCLRSVIKWFCVCDHRPGTLHDFRSHEIADQLTLLDAELFYNIEVPESPLLSLFCFQFWLCYSDLTLYLSLFLSLLRFLRCCFGPRNRTRKRVPIWLSSQSTLTIWATGESWTWAYTYRLSMHYITPTR